VAVSVADEQELLSPQQAASRLGFSRQHVMRLIEYGELAAQKLPGSTYWKIPLASVLALQDDRERGSASQLQRYGASQPGTGLRPSDPHPPPRA
jgi:excisionase family DNA binding protein